MSPVLNIRPLSRRDRLPLAKLLRAQAHFRPAEVKIALELIDLALSPSGQQDYVICCAEGAGGELSGYICYGQAPLTDAVYDLYWIVVHPAQGRRGTGTALLVHAEEDLRRRGARLLLIETSSLPSYAVARAFYHKHGYGELARIPDYYAMGDHKVIFGKIFLP